jgi:signal transduction histidine kinase
MKAQGRRTARRMMRGGLMHRMVIASGLLALVLSAVFVILLLAIADLRASARLAGEAQQELTAADRLEKLIVDLETGVRGFVITGEERFLEPWEAARTAFPTQAGRLMRISLNGEQARRARWIARAGTAYIRDYSLPLVNAARRGDPAARSVAATDEGRRRVDALRAAFDRFAATERAVITARQRQADADARRAIIAAAAGIGGSIVLIALFGAYLAWVIVVPARRAATMARRLADGDLATRMPETGVGEIGALERAFNTMAGSLERSRDRLSRLAEEQAALRRVATLVARTGSPSETFRTVTRQVGLLSGADLARMERYEPDGTVTGVARWSRDDDEQLSVGTRFALEGVSIAALVRERIGPVRVDSFVDATGPIAEEARALGIRSSVGCPIIVEGSLWGVIAASSRSETPFPPDTESQIAEFTELVATAIANAQSRAELAASRARVVTTADEARRRLARDLHDGAQQRLVHTVITLKLARQALGEADGPAIELVDEALDHAERATDQLRELAHGIRPAALSRGGLRAGVEMLASRIRLPLSVDVTPQRFAPALETAAYFIVAESLTNVVKHAQATSAQVKGFVDGGRLHLEVRDDGVGGAKLGRGSGLLGLQDRAGALDGELRVESPPGAGTVIAATLPVDE